jgi:Rrf2 family protein
MRITRSGEYSILAVLAILREEQGGRSPVQVSEIATAFSLPTAYIARLLANLTRAGILRSTRGHGGGFQLRRDGQDITLLEVVEAADGPIELDAKLDELARQAPLAAEVSKVLLAAVHSVRERFAKVRLIDLASSGSSLPAYDRIMPSNRDES